MLYKHTITGATLETESKISGEFWEKAGKTASSKKSAAPANKEVEPEKEK